MLQRIKNPTKKGMNQQEPVRSNLTKAKPNLAAKTPNPEAPRLLSGSHNPINWAKKHLVVSPKK